MKKDIAAMIEKLRRMHGKARAELNYSNPLELTVAVVLSAQCTDERVNRVTKDLFKKYKRLRDYISAPQEQVEEDIRPTGFYKSKARSLRNIAREIDERFDGRVPDDVDTLATVKGIGRKSANMIVGLAYGKAVVIVDTHLNRVANRLGLTRNDDPDKVETDLKAEVPEKWWTDFSLLTILHGRYICKARKPDCPHCLLQKDCDYFESGAVS